MRLVVFVFDTGTVLNLIGAEALYFIWLERIPQRGMLEIRSESDTRLTVSGTARLHFRMSESHISVKPGVVDKLALSVLLRTNFFDQFLQSINGAERKQF